MVKKEAKSDKSVLLLELLHKSVVFEAEKCLSLAELLEIPSDNIQHHLNAVRFPPTNSSLSPQRFVLEDTKDKGAFSQQEVATGTAHVKYSPVVGTDEVVIKGISRNIYVKHRCITCMKEYEGKSLEELRLEDYMTGHKGCWGSGFQPTGETKLLFGASSTFSFDPAAQNTPQSTEMFNQPAESTAKSPGLFSQPVQSTAKSPGLFAQPIQSTAKSPGLFAQPVQSTVKSPGLFAQPVQSTVKSPGLFGQHVQSTAKSTGLLDQLPESTAKSTGLFGQPVQSTAKSLGLFAQPVQSTAKSTRLFGQPVQSTAKSTGLFGQPVQSAAKFPGLFTLPVQSTANSTGLFGQPVLNTPQSTGIFGQPAQGTAKSTGLLGQPAQCTPQSTGIFGQPVQSTPQSTGIFGQPVQGTAKSTGLLGQPAQCTPQSTGIFGQPVQSTPQSTGIFGQPVQGTAKSTGLLGQPAQCTPQSTGIFGQPAQSTAKSTGLSGQLAQSTEKSTGLLGQPVQSTVQPTGLFGPPAQSTSQCTGLFGQPAQEQDTKYLIDEHSDSSASDQSSFEVINENEAEILEVNSLHVLASDDENTENLNIENNINNSATAKETAVQDKSITEAINTGVKHDISDEKGQDQDVNFSQFIKFSKTLKLDTERLSTLQKNAEESSSNESLGFKVIACTSNESTSETLEHEKFYATEKKIHNKTVTKLSRKILNGTNNAESVESSDSESIEDEMKMKESEVKKQTASILNLVKPIGYQPSTREEVTVKGNKEDVIKCIDIAETAISEGNLVKAERFLLKSERIYPTLEAKKLLQNIRIVKEAKTNVAFVESPNNNKDRLTNNEGLKLSENAPKAFSDKKYNEAKIFSMQGLKIGPRDNKAKVHIDETGNSKENEINKHSDDITKNEDNNNTITEAFNLLRKADILILNGNIEEAEKLVIKSKGYYATEAANKILEKINRISEENKSKLNSYTETESTAKYHEDIFCQKIRSHEDFA